MNMQNQQKKKKAKQPLIYKPYLKGNWHDGAAARRGVGLMLYYLLFGFLFVVAGSALNFGGTAVRVTMNILMILVCAAILYMNAAKLGESEVAFAEIALARQNAGKTIDKKDRERCFHPLKGVFIALIAAIPLLLLAVPHALTSVKRVYSLQLLPNWVSGYANQSEISVPLSYYQQQTSITALDILHMIVRILIFPFVNIATTDNADALLFVDRLSPLLVLCPLLGYPLGYLTGPRARAMVHGDISTSNSRHQRRKLKAQKRRQARQPKKNELV